MVLHRILLNPEGQAQDKDRSTVLLFFTIKSDADVKQCTRFNPMRDPMMQSLRETAVNFHSHECDEGISDTGENFCAFGESTAIVLRTSRSTLRRSIVSGATDSPSIRVGFLRWNALTLGPP